MSHELNPSLDRSISHLEKGTKAGGNINSALDDVYEELMKGDLTNRERVGFMQEFTRTVHQRGLFPDLVESYVSKNFGDLDLDSNGFISDSELKDYQKSSLTRDSITPMEQQIIRYMSANLSEIANGEKDQSLWGESSISLEDVKSYKTQEQALRYKSTQASKAERLFGSKEGFKHLDKNGNGFISERELNEARKSNSPVKGVSAREFQDSVDFLATNKKEIYKSINDQKWQFESEITLKDLKEFAKNNRYPDLN